MIINQIADEVNNNDVDTTTINNNDDDDDDDDNVYAVCNLKICFEKRICIIEITHTQNKRRHKELKYVARKRIEYKHNNHKQTLRGQ